MSPQSHDDRRNHTREDVSLPGAAFVLCESSLRAIEVWTRNISAGGVSLLSREELRGERMLLQLPQPAFAGKLIECEVRHRSRYDRELLSGAIETTHVCGLKFDRVLSEEGVHESLRSAFGISLPAPPIIPSRPLVPDAPDDEESLMPLLSAIGLAVVYASILP